ncbi:MAG: peptidylprolyl isomerase [Candidatus Krumholzibacteria bacterium]|nr:peptidylprolyl isomerase [Candidatus Krumholzibacteria bacterium]
MPKCHHLASVTTAVVLALVACSGDKSEESGGNATSRSFPNSVVDHDVLVRVNSQPIYGKDLRLFTLVYGTGTVDSLNNASYNLRTLDGLIDRILLLQEADVMGIAIDDSTHRWYVRQFVNAGGGDAAVDELLSTTGITRSELNQLIGKDLTIRKFLETTVLQPIAIPDSVAMAYYLQNPNEFISPDSVRARHIIIRASQTDTDADKKAKRETLLNLSEQVKAGEDFAELAKEYSEGPSAPRGGDLGYFTHGDMVPAFSDVTFALQPGQVSGLVETRFGFHIIQVIDRKESRKLEYEEVEAGLKAQLNKFYQSQNLQNHLQRSRSVAIIENNY